MVDDMDWAAIMDSEVFREYVAAELTKEAEIAAQEPRVKTAAIDLELDEQFAIYEGFDKFEATVKASPELLQKFRMAKQALIDHPELVEKVDKNFVNGLMMMDLESAAEETADIEVSID